MGTAAHSSISLLLHIRITRNFRCHLLSRWLSCSAYSTLMMEAISSSEMSVDFQRTTWRYKEQGQRSLYNDWLRAGRPRGRSSSPGAGKNFHFSMSSRPTMGPTQPPIEWVPGAISPGVKRPGSEADHSRPTSA
jgi:hypothetical protein